MPGERLENAWRKTLTLKNKTKRVTGDTFSNIFSDSLLRLRHSDCETDENI